MTYSSFPKESVGSIGFVEYFGKNGVLSVTYETAMPPQCQEDTGNKEDL